MALKWVLQVQEKMLFLVKTQDLKFNGSHMSIALFGENIVAKQESEKKEVS